MALLVFMIPHFVHNNLFVPSNFCHHLFLPYSYRIIPIRSLLMWLFKPGRSLSTLRQLVHWWLTLSQPLFPALGCMGEELIVESWTTQSSHAIRSNLQGEKTQCPNSGKTMITPAELTLKMSKRGLHLTCSRQLDCVCSMCLTVDTFLILCSIRMCYLTKHFKAGDRKTTYLSVHLWQQLQQLLLRVCGEGWEGPHVDESSNVGVDQDGAWCFKVYIHPSSTPFHGPCHKTTYI